MGFRRRTSMHACFLAVLCLVSLSVEALLLFKPKSEIDPLEGAADLDSLFELHDHVFMARVDAVKRPGVLAGADVRKTADLFVYQPPLKGPAPESLSYTMDGTRAPDFSEGTVYLIFSNDLTQTPLRSEVRTMLAHEAGPAVAWIVDWVQEKHSTQPILGSLDQLNWERRVLIVDARSMALDVVSVLQRRAGEVQERDLVWWVVTVDGLRSNFTGRVTPELRRDLQENERPANARVRLIGKDGGVKLEAGLLDLDRVFSRIDSMPMRARERQ